MEMSLIKIILYDLSHQKAAVHEFKTSLFSICIHQVFLVNEGFDKNINVSSSSCSLTRLWWDDGEGECYSRLYQYLPTSHHPRCNVHHRSTSPTKRAEGTNKLPLQVSMQYIWFTCTCAIVQKYTGVEVRKNLNFM